MSSASPLRRSLPETSARGLGRIESLLTASFRCLAFWLAVALPFLLIGLMAVGLAGQHVPLFGGLLTANLVALRLGHPYNRE